MLLARPGGRITEEDRPGFINTPILGKDEAMKTALGKLHGFLQFKA